jgi:hypothetical protein
MGPGELVGPQGQVIDHLKIKVKQFIDCVHKKIGVLEIGEQEKIHQHTQKYSEFFPAYFFCMMDQFSQVIIGKGGEDQNQEKKSGGFPVKEETGDKKESVPRCTSPVNKRIDQQDHRVEGPEEEPGENQWLLGIIKEYVSQYLLQDSRFWIDTPDIQA